MPEERTSFAAVVKRRILFVIKILIHACHPAPNVHNLRLGRYLKSPVTMAEFPTSPRLPHALLAPVRPKNRSPPIPPHWCIHGLSL